MPQMYINCITFTYTIFLKSPKIKETGEINQNSIDT